ncbi:MAG: ArsR family transcriptional regulator [Chlamydiia bacterium]|nr:ArsR family transcriptional regulator [Chlamydiia bacterium]
MTDETSTRVQLLRHLRLKGSLSASALAKKLGVTLSAVRQQLALLDKEGMIQHESRVQGRGRPEHLYSLTEGAEPVFEKHYDEIALELLQAVERVGGGAQVDAVLAARRELQFERWREELEAVEPDARLRRLAELLEAAGYMTQVQKAQDRLVLQEHNCPHLDVARRFPSVCEQERKLFEQLLGQEVQMTQSRIAGDKHCCFCTAHSS